MSPRYLLASVACAAALSTGIGFAAAQLSEPDAAPARAASAEVKELKKLNAEIADMSEAIGPRFSIGDGGHMVGYLHDIERHTSETCDAVGGGSECTTIFSSRGGD